MRPGCAPRTRVVACLGVWAAAVSCGVAAPEVRFSGETMGTTYHVTIANPSTSAARWQPAIDTLLERVNDLMSTYRVESELSRVNHGPAGEWIPVSPELHRVLRAAAEVSEWTGGAFDATVGPLVNLWGFGPVDRGVRLPTAGEIAAARERTGPGLLALRDEPPAVRKGRADVYVDLSAIAKGFGVDEVAALLDGRGARNYLVEIGGEVRVRGVNARGGPWRVAVERPDAGVRGFSGVLALTDRAVATSGDYRNYFERDGRRYSHAIDPRTGEPVDHDLALVTVVDTSTMMADGWATGLLVLGPEEGYRLAERFGLAALFVRRTDSGLVAHATPTFTPYLGGE